MESNNTLPQGNNSFPPLIKKILIGIISLFLISSVPNVLVSIIHKVSLFDGYSIRTIQRGYPFNVYIMYVWFLAAAGGMLLILSTLITGFVRGFQGKGYALVGVALLLFVILILVGAGTCMVNLVGVQI